jgi:hypothetical protein
MKNIGKPERASQNRVIQLFQKELGYAYLGNWEEGNRTQSIEEDLLKAYLLKKGYSEVLAQRAVDQLVKTVTHLYQKDFIHFNFPLPKSKSEQTAIAQILSDMDENLAQLEEKKA